MNGKRFRYAVDENLNTLAADADFCIVGTIPADPKPEGPFGDHLGYYSLVHDFPYMIDAVYHRDDAIWPFTTVGRPPQEDASFGDLIHELTGHSFRDPRTQSYPRGRCSRRSPTPSCCRDNYTPYRKPRPQELLTVANAILGKIRSPCEIPFYSMKKMIRSSTSITLTNSSINFSAKSIFHETFTSKRKRLSTPRLLQ